ncbi:ABC transporter permease [Georgenia sp. MJ170]|uniref:ABC transporter permease n=2 Tax=Georgenia sunbinii TaxID=3117728 RepID=UPI002F2614FC
MRRLIHGETIRLLATRLPRWAALLAVVLGAGMVGLIAAVGPENATPPMPGLDTPEGVSAVLGLLGVLLFVPALLGTLAMTSEYQHRTVSTTFVAVPRRGRVLAAKLVTYTGLGLSYGVLSAVAAGIALYAATAAHGTAVGAPVGDVIDQLLRIAVAAAVYTLIGVGIGAIARHQLLAAAATVGYFYLVEPLVMLLPGINAVYALLPGGATTALTRSTYLVDAVGQQTGTGVPVVGDPWLGGLVLLGYAATAAVVALALPVRRDVVG